MVLGGGAFGSSLGHVGGAPMNGIIALVRRDTGQMIFVFMYGYSTKVVVCIPDTKSAGTLVVNFLASRMMRNKCFRLSHPVYGICCGSSNRLRHLPSAFYDSNLASVGQPWSLFTPSWRFWPQHSSPVSVLSLVFAILHSWVWSSTLLGSLHGITLLMVASKFLSDSLLPLMATGSHF